MHCSSIWRTRSEERGLTDLPPFSHARISALNVMVSLGTPARFISSNTWKNKSPDTMVSHALRTQAFLRPRCVVLDV